MITRLINFVIFGSALTLAATVLGAWGDSGDLSPGAQGVAFAGGTIDVGSLLLGLAAGVVFGQVVGVRWAQVPQRMIRWLERHHENLMRLALGLLCAGVLVYW